MLPKSAISYVDESAKKASHSADTEKQVNQDEEATAIQKPEEYTEEDEMVRLERVGIHTKSGMQYCHGDRKFYVKILTKFLKEARQKAMEINKFYQQGDLDNYTILVHALKSTARMLGADALSENAKAMEAAAKNRDENYVSEHHESILDQYQQVTQSNCKVLDLDKNDAAQETVGDTVEISKDELLRQLSELKEGLDTFEADKAEALVAEIGKTVYRGEPVSELLREIGQDVDDFEFTSASEKVETLIKKVEGGEAG